MKKHVLILILSITASLFSLTSCGNTAGAEESINTEVEESVVYTPDPTASPTSDPSSSSEYVTDEMRESLKTLGATDDEINNIKSEKDMTNLVDKLITGGGTTGSSDGSGSSSSDTGSDDFFNEVHDPSRVPDLGVPTVGGRM